MDELQITESYGIDMIIFCESAFVAFSNNFALILILKLDKK